MNQVPSCYLRTPEKNDAVAIRLTGHVLCTVLFMTPTVPEKLFIELEKIEFNQLILSIPNDEQLFYLLSAGKAKEKMPIPKTHRLDTKK